ncbi:DUF2309 domain-containing protein [Gimesia aquarii]|uniref:Probable inorganic carbon transporter subunit DabA n=1 Tax=Gimesia aquarii TaxID=2527964 RepID=A0A517W040_9PLAN|nr:DUF2309 domain-containing protein [Gimesia aquarii]QDT98617.1 hypothetical protein V144x_41240 [Gimesia aquarii]
MISQAESTLLPLPSSGTLEKQAVEQPHIIEQVAEVLKQVNEVIAPVWPLNDYVAVNPYNGISERSFLNARNFLRVFSDCETLMPLEHYANEFQQGQFNRNHIEAALVELKVDGIGNGHLNSVTEIEEMLKQIGGLAHESSEAANVPNNDRRIRTLSEFYDQTLSANWTPTICDEVSKYCSMHYDEGQAVWSSPWSHLSLYESWRSAALHDRNVEVLGLKGFRSYVSKLPQTAEASIIYSLQSLNVLPELWETFLLCQAFTIPGWSAWTKYQSEQSEQSAEFGNDLAGLLAMRLAYDAALAKSFSFNVNWASYASGEPVSFKFPHHAGDDEFLRYTLLRASEIGYRNRLLNSVPTKSRKNEKQQNGSESVDSGTNDSKRKLAQMVFCIDVRSERIRRQIESLSNRVETFGFAGFFGLPIEFVRLGEQSGDSHVPVLLKPQFQLHEELHTKDESSLSKTLQDRSLIRSFRKLWKSLQTSAVGCFSFVETTGLFYGFKLLGRTVNVTDSKMNAGYDGIGKANHEHLKPTLESLNQQGISTSDQIELAESMLKNLGLTENFARLVAFCGHASQTENNPLKAGLDCGACGGHSGEPNARLAAMLLNHLEIRQALADRNIHIPDDTYFLGGLHNTTTDKIELFDLEMVPESHQADLQELQNYSQSATEQTQVERMPSIGSQSLADLLRRAGDWSEVRPEWGLAGNAAFIVAPRSLTKEIDLDGRSFLHSYNHQTDPEGEVLENIMTAPMIVAHWINMQYYASTVDNHHFGSGNKTLHNVVGGFGILSGNSGDLMTGLPWQSLHSGEDYQHLPMRLQVVIAAPRESIEKAIKKHQMIANLLGGGWLHLIALDHETRFQYTEDGNWEEIDLN